MNISGSREVEQGVEREEIHLQLNALSSSVILFAVRLWLIGVLKRSETSWGSSNPEQMHPSCILGDDLQMPMYQSFNVCALPMHIKPSIWCDQNM